MAKIVRNPKILAGKPTIEGTRISVELILNLLAHGQTTEDIIEDYPYLITDDIKAVIDYAQKAVEKAYPARRVVAHEVSGRRKHK